MMIVSVFYRLTIIVCCNDDGFSVLQSDYNCLVMMMVSVFYRVTIIVCCNDDGFIVLQSDYNCLS